MQQGHEPTVLDWTDKSELRTRFPECSFVSAASHAGLLPYIDASIDLVAVNTTGDRSLDEARRVANVAVVVISADNVTDKAHVTLDWKKGVGIGARKTSIIVSSGGTQYTKGCVASVLEHLPSGFDGEVFVVVRKADPELARLLRDLLRTHKRATMIEADAGDDLFGATMRAASQASGEILVFVNDDTVPLSGWLPPLLRTFRDYPTAGVVAPRVVFPDGALKAVGGLILKDGGLLQLGEGDRGQLEHWYDFVHEIDYCTNACWATTRSLFIEYFTLANESRSRDYSELAYCLEAKNKGFNAYYQPESTVVQVATENAGSEQAEGDVHRQAHENSRLAAKWSESFRDPWALPLAAGTGTTHSHMLNGEGRGCRSHDE